MSALDNFLTDDEVYPVVVIQKLKVNTREALRELDASKADMSDLALVITAQQKQLVDLQTLSANYVAALQASLADRQQLNARVAALEARTLVGTTGQLTKNLTLGVGGTTTTYGVTFAKAMPSANYIPLVTLDSSSVSLLGTTSVVYPITDKTAFGCTVTVRNSALLTVASSVTVYVAALQLA